MSQFPIGAPSPNEPESVHQAWKAARNAWQVEQACGAEIEALAVTLRASDPRIKAAQIKETEAEDATNNAVSLLFDEIRWTRDAGRRERTGTAA